MGILENMKMRKCEKLCHQLFLGSHLQISEFSH